MTTIRTSFSQKSENTAAVFTAPYRSYSSSEQLKAYDSEISETFSQIASSNYRDFKISDNKEAKLLGKKSAKVTQYNSDGVYTPLINTLENHLGDLSDILSGTYSRTQKRDAWKWTDRSAYVTQTVNSLTNEITSALKNKSITTHEAAEILDIAKTKIDIRFMSDEYAQSRIAAGKLDKNIMQDAYETLTSAIQKYEKAASEGIKYLSKSKSHGPQRKKVRSLEENLRLAKEGEIAAIHEISTLRTDYAAVLAQKETAVAQAENSRAEHEAVETQLHEALQVAHQTQDLLVETTAAKGTLENLVASQTQRADVAESNYGVLNASYGKLEAQNAVLLSEKQELMAKNTTAAQLARAVAQRAEIAETQLGEEKANYAALEVRSKRTEDDLLSRLLISQQETAQAQAQRDAIPRFWPSVVSTYQRAQSNFAQYRARKSQEREQAREQSRLKNEADLAAKAAELEVCGPPVPTVFQRLGVATRALYASTKPARTRVSQSLANNYRTARQRSSQAIESASQNPNVKKGALIAAGLALATGAYLFLAKYDRMDPQGYMIVDCPPASPKVEVASAVSETKQEKDHIIQNPKFVISSDYSLLGFSEMQVPNVSEFFADHRKVSAPAPKIVEQQPIVETKINPEALAVDDGNLNFSPKAREQFRLLEKRLDRVGEFTDGKTVSIGSVPYLQNKYPGHEANDFHAANFDTALSPNALRDFTEKESLEMMIEKDNKVVATNIPVPDSNNSEYADFTREAIANNYLTAEQANRLEDLAEVNARTRIRRLFKIPFLPIPGTHTTDGRTVEVKQK